MTSPVPRITDIAATGPTQLRVAWRDGVDTLVDLAGWIATGDDVLAPLRDAVMFAAARIGEYGASLAWGDEDGDLAIDAFHLRQIATEQANAGTFQPAAWQAELRLSNQEVADFLGLSLSTWNAYKAGARVPTPTAMLCGAALRDPILLHAHFKPRRAGRPRKAPAP
ncbi:MULTISPECIES: DUF2442 domain-containing protein [Methylobacterium]|uniref:DUF2442 domain-containing protein n=1 Tax=Methylobacterium thuringiense TaxID=1003091 RepID=A0ABQ4TN21_9HYPH|nr:MULTISPECIES: DUF2442 domain-containing protein [Methylobacterium]TXN20911.1 DUF2442 domain-containing protein [Methylobacterium sp. WL9]GJE56043.1 hypothetical protein EKPJFOCH_2540 [Methylobacterium thuringiense]